jgi:hypothetical protein
VADPPSNQQSDTHSKALALNLDESIYGTFAEIGAGQEVARWFLSVGAASGTVAQTISAYDKVFSDDTYGAGTRYVSKERLLAMLDREYRLLLGRLGPTRGAQSRFFVFADTVAARNYQGTNEQHGWLGIRFQADPGGEPNQILLHINLRDTTADLQQQAIGILGVHLVYAAYHQRSSQEVFLGGLFDEMSSDRIEVDVLELQGPVFAGADSRLWCLELIRRSMAQGIVFDSQVRVVEPASVLRKRPLIVFRDFPGRAGAFNPALLRASQSQLLAEGVQAEKGMGVVLERNLQPAGATAAIASPTMLARIEQLAALGLVAVTGLPEAYSLVAYLRRYTTEPIRLIGDIAGLVKNMEEQAYQALPGALLEGLGRLLASNVKLYVAPMREQDFLAAFGGMPEGFTFSASAGGWVTADNVVPKPPVDHLFEYLRAAGRIVPLAV